eukprot:CAMPEP_0202697312 /NCGR_PEP_ID=MMETSP1385-20130828/10639_1 /ASSEMBLY_ACC=CAM_ASM_000861 /TAXON_ID=933848 /ORGANISM="Elphidium margaritaceum" /LENGTH=67 /DNA_ID=CAMNT_0049353741 /DNA_START=10 /DNA_END=213 /DNA_ORIENTATION=-
MHGAFVRGFKTFVVKDCCADSSQQLHDLVIDRYWHMLPIRNIADDLKAKGKAKENNDTKDTNKPNTK